MFSSKQILLSKRFGSSCPQMMIDHPTSMLKVVVEVQSATIMRV
jgi:hypothetical protein